MAQLIYLHSVPGSGTHFVKGLLNSHPDIGVISFEADGGASLKAIEKLYFMLCSETSEDTFCSLLSLASWAIWNDPACFELARKADYSGEPHKHIRPFVCLVGHIYPQEWGLSVNTLIPMKELNAKAIVPLRDPLLIFTNWIIKAAESPEMTQTMMLRVHYGLSWLNEHYGKEPVPTHYLPIERPAAYSDLIGLFEDFIGTTIPGGVRHYANEWSPVNAIPYGLRFNRSDAQRDLIERCYQIRRLAKQGCRWQDFFGVVPLVDAKVEWLKQCNNLKALYEDHGYRNLCWF